MTIDLQVTAGPWAVLVVQDVSTGKILDTAPVCRRFVGQTLVRLLRWLRARHDHVNVIVLSEIQPGQGRKG